VYGILYALGHWTAAAVAGLAIMLAILAGEMRTANVKIIDLTSLGFFVLALIMLLTVGDQIFNRYHIILVWGVFAVVTWATILVGFPFTLQLARESARQEVWREPLFRRVHLRLTTVWGAIFTLDTTLVSCLANIYRGRGAFAGRVEAQKPRNLSEMCALSAAPDHKLFKRHNTSDRRARRKLRQAAVGNYPRREHDFRLRLQSDLSRALPK